MQGIAENLNKRLTMKLTGKVLKPVKIANKKKTNRVIRFMPAIPKRSLFRLRSPKGPDKIVLRLTLVLVFGKR